MDEFIVGFKDNGTMNVLKFVKQETTWEVFMIMTQMSHGDPSW
jgi:hypothetical protein